MNDRFQNFGENLASPARRAVAVTPDDSAELPFLPRALYVGGGGHLVVRLADAAADVTFRNVAAGQILDIRACFVRASGTTASDILGLA